LTRAAEEVQSEPGRGSEDCLAAAHAAASARELGLPDLSGLAEVPDSATRCFRDKGHAVLRGLASAAEIEAYRPAILETAPRRRWDHRPLALRDTYGQAFLQMMNLWTLDPRVRAFVFARRFASAAARLLGIDAVRLYHDQALWKEPGGGFTPWHQDQFYWPLDTPHTITIWLPLVPVTAEMGAMVFASRSHRLGSLGDFAIGDVSEERFAAAVEEYGLPVEGYAPFAPGDASFHAGWTLHRADANRSERMREVMTIIYYADGARVGPLDHPNRRLDRDIWLAGCEPGEPAAGPHNPVLYRAGD
jgi:ectoine hydroxylase-related dioxygenase (phytanoyl-CoA dioxygenase family)